ncbi:MAG: hypothetical protein V4793_34740 [Paraburkholderia tropica]|nr:hypothetical protein [Paraburkholderia tropica]MBB2999056.1 hypothetical protein [Paraburkholderia tropica]MBB6319044.1 hypothetical protein [Paraburkholderia tropica]MDE1138787.1 hypothetical protein [Paraburkholderia tropica]
MVDLLHRMRFFGARIAPPMHALLAGVLSAQRLPQFQRNFYFRSLMMRLIVISATGRGATSGLPGMPALSCK